jgi:hypothetical protein
MRELPPAQTVTTTPPAGKAAIVFVRPSQGGSTASVFEMKKDGDVFIGHVLPFKKLLYLTDPGRTRFMVSGAAMEFMDADLQSGKTYYVGVVARSGSGFALRPVTQAEDPELQRLLQISAWTETGPDARAWAKARTSQFQQKKAKTLPRWEARSDKPVLRAEHAR